jgi:hypothetical protein
MNTEMLRTMIKGQPPEQLIEELAVKSKILKDQRKSFRTASSRFSILSVYETLETPTLKFDVSLHTMS